MVYTFIAFLFMFVAIGVSSAARSKGTKKDYYLASGTIRPWLVGLSAVATNNSGYMFIGVIGYTYATGLASIWLMVGWITGDYILHSMCISACGVLRARPLRSAMPGCLLTGMGRITRGCNA